MVAAVEVDLEAAEAAVRDGVLAIGARLLEAGVAARGTGKAGPRRPCPCGGAARFEGYRAKEVQTVVGWITVRRAYYACAACGHGHCPLDAALGLRRDSLSPGVRRLAGRFGALLPFAEAARTLAETARVRLSASTVRTVTEAVGARREAAGGGDRRGLDAGAAAGPGRAAGAALRGHGRGAHPGHRRGRARGQGRGGRPGAGTRGRARRERASYVAGLETAAAFGPRLALEAHRRGLEGAGRVAVLGDGAAWIWNLAAEHFPGAVQIVDWFHASERVWELGRALYGAETTETTAWVEPQLARLAGRGGGPGHRVGGAAVSRGGGRRARRAGDLLHQPGPAHGLRPLPGRGLGHRLRHGRERLQAPHRRPREGSRHALERGRRPDRRRRARPALQRAVGRP